MFDTELPEYASEYAIVEIFVLTSLTSSSFCFASVCLGLVALMPLF